MNLRWLPPFFLIALLWGVAGVLVKERYGLAMGTAFLVSLVAGAVVAAVLRSWFKRRHR